MKNPFKQIDFKKLNDLILYLNPNIKVFSACDASGEVFWFNEPSYKSQISLITTEIHENIRSKKNNIRSMYFRTSREAESLYHIVLFDMAERPCGRLSIIVNTDDNEQKENEESLSLVASIATKERELLSELNSMAFAGHSAAHMPHPWQRASSISLTPSSLINGT